MTPTAQSAGWSKMIGLSYSRKDLVLADGVSVVALQFAKDDRGNNRPRAQGDKRIMDPMDHLRRIGVKPIGNEEYRSQ